MPLSFPQLFGSAPRPPRWPGRTRDRLALFAGIAAFSLMAIAAIAPPPLPTAAQEYQAFLEANAQKLDVHDGVVQQQVVRDGYSATPGIQTLAASGTNYDWAKMVLLMAGLPMTENNVTVFTRWMRQENYVDAWWNRNNPLNNGWGSGGGGGLGSYDSLVIAAENAAEALLTNGGYSGIVAAFAADSPTAVTEAAIWASPWATGHYNNGAHWSYAEVPVITAPADAWQ
ncbi:hypothetical protein [Schumannella luteola]